MRSADFGPRRSWKSQSSSPVSRRSIQIAIAVIAVAAIILAVMLRPGETTPGTAAPPATAKPGPTAAAVAAPTVAPSTPTAVPTKEPRVHTVAAGDTLMSLAEKYYGDVNKFNKIFDANKDVLKSPDSLQLGQKLKIPD